MFDAGEILKKISLDVIASEAKQSYAGLWFPWDRHVARHIFGGLLAMTQNI